MTIEVWRDVDDWPGYEVSDQGRVRRGARLKAPDQDRKGYLRVKLWKNGKSKNRLIHGLVAAAFIGPRPAGCICRHADGDNQNNCYVNLSYGTPTENEADKIAHGAGRCPLSGWSTATMIKASPLSPTKPSAATASRSKR
nr:NUMOD4 domain-containing protein [Pseudomonas syringae]